MTMKKLLFTILSMMIILSSCETNKDGKLEMSGMGWVLIILALCLLFFVGDNNNKKESPVKKRMRDLNMSYSQFYPLGTYVGGHPNLDHTKEQVYFRKVDDLISFYRIETIGTSMPDNLHVNIEIDSIENITIEDASSIEKKITVGRIFLVGVFALAWKKKKKNEVAFVSIEWKRGKFSHSTLFTFEGADAFEKANIARNKLISICEPSEQD